MKRCFLLFVVIFQLIAVRAQTKTAPGLAAITEEGLKKDLYALAGDHFRGREAGTLDELKAAMWWADLLRKEGLQPAGDDHTYFQFFSMWRNRIAASSTVSIGGQSMPVWKDVLVAQTAPAVVTAPIVFVGDASTAALANLDINGKAVAVQVSAEGINLNVSLPERRYPGYVLRKYAAGLLAKGAVAIIFIADEMGEKSWSQVLPALTRGLYDIEDGPNASTSSKAPVLWIHGRDAALVKNNANLAVQLNVERFEYP
ncbi:MAG TPA: hypothetical protein VL307_12875, partial [Chitinophagaceae bacterium]|nr:hypothetical protein [Chitinophagaceae bacterium]